MDRISIHLHHFPRTLDAFDSNTYGTYNNFFVILTKHFLDFSWYVDALNNGSKKKKFTIIKLLNISTIIDLVYRYIVFRYYFSYSKCLR